MDKIKIIFVCLANYCRSPMAEGVFTTLVARDGYETAFEISSAGTKDWDVGLRPDSRGLRLLAQHGYHLIPYKRAQMITADEIRDSDYVIAMSQRVADELGNGENVHLLLDFVPDLPTKDIPDPYPNDTFPEAFNLIKHGVKAFYASLKGEGMIPG